MNTDQVYIALQADLDQREAALMETVRKSDPEAVLILTASCIDQYKTATLTAAKIIASAAAIALDRAVLQTRKERDE
jgi:hypothetical protein